MKACVLVLVIIVNIIYCSNAQGSFELQLPSLGGLVTRITDTTFGLVRGGITIFSKTIERIINRFSRVEDRLRELLEEFRKLIVRGIPEFNIPILDPLHVDKIDFNIAHESAKINGSVEDVTVKHISKFTIDKQKFTVLSNLEFKLDLNLTFPLLVINGFYELDGAIGDMFTVFGNGRFWLHLIDFKVGTSAIVKFKYPGLRVTALNVDLKLKKLENNFENFMGDKEMGELFNKAISRMAPEALDILWPDIKQPIERQILKYINHILDNTTIASLARRLFNIA